MAHDTTRPTDDDLDEAAAAQLRARPGPGLPGAWGRDAGHQPRNGCLPGGDHMSAQRPSEKAATVGQHEDAIREHESLANLARDTGMRKEEQEHRMAAAAHRVAFRYMKNAASDKAWLQDALLASKDACKASTRAWQLVDARRAKPLPKLTPGQATQPDPGTKAATVDEHAQAFSMHRSSAADARTRGEAEVAKAHDKAATLHERASKALASRDPAVRASGTGTGADARKASASAWAVVRTYGGTPSQDAAAAIRTGGAWRVLGEMFAEYRDAVRFAVDMALETEEDVGVEHLLAGKLVDAITVRAQPEEV